MTRACLQHLTLRAWRVKKNVQAVDCAGRDCMDSEDQRIKAQLRTAFAYLVLRGSEVNLSVFVARLGTEATGDNGPRSRPQPYG